MNAPSFTWPVRVYYEDTDAGGVVYHAAYLRFMERARTEWLRALGFEQDALRERYGILFAVRRLAIEYRRPARLDDLLHVTAALSGNGRVSFDFEQQVLAADDTTRCCRAQVNIACLTADGLRPTRIPDPVRHALHAPAP